MKSEQAQVAIFYTVVVTRAPEADITLLLVLRITTASRTTFPIIHLDSHGCICLRIELKDILKMVADLKFVAI